MTESQPTADDCRTAVELALWKALQIARIERDEARREVCELAAADANKWNRDLRNAITVSEQDIADERGWDCWKEKA